MAKLIISTALIGAAALAAASMIAHATQTHSTCDSCSSISHSNMDSTQSVQQTLVIFKPDCMGAHLDETVLQRLIKVTQARVVADKKNVQLDDTILRKHYAHLTEKPFFPEILNYMKSSSVRIVVLEGRDVVAKVRQELGPTDSKKAPKGTIRGDYGKDVTHNIAHASDSPETAQQEIERFFPEGIVANK